MNWKILRQRTWLNLIGAIILVVGLARAASPTSTVPIKPQNKAAGESSDPFVM